MQRIRLYGGLSLLLDLPPQGMDIEELPPPKRVILPLSDPNGPVCKAVVKAGQEVFRGQKVGEDPEQLMLPVHSPVSGRVTDIRDLRYPDGGNMQALFIESDGKQQGKGGLIPHKNYLEGDPKKLIMSMREAGVEIIPFGLLPDTERSGNVTSSIRHFVINGIGYGFAGSIARQLVAKRSADLLEGIKLIQRVFQPERVYLAIDEKHEDAVQATMQSGLDKHVEMVKLDVFYPLGHPYLLFKRIFNREIPSPHGNAIDLGVVFADVDTIVQAFEAVKEGKPKMERYLTVSGEAIKAPKNLKVPIGTPLKDVIDFCGGFTEKPGRVVLGNPLNGTSQLSLESPVLKDTRWVWVQPERLVVAEKYRSCIGCGDCVDVCPVRVMPNFLGKFCEFGKYEEAARQYNLYTCIECGLCSYVCPSRRPMVHFIRFGKWELALKEKQNAKQ
jgi:electron transport complex protein RnfC